MEGDGEGMVAIVQGLRDAGLAVTLMGGRQRRASVIAIKPSSQVAHAKSTMETSTSALPAAASVDTAVQICDDRYTSSYQLAHCRVRPSSPPVPLAEFPPQRPEPCRTQGNFEIGGIGSGEANVPIQASQQFRNSFTCVDRGLLSNSRSSRGTEAFAHSLRKYPSISPNRSISTELVQRLLAYTQAKNFSKSSYHSKSMRSIRNKTESPKEIAPKTKSSKSVQTYTRSKAKENAPKPEIEEKESLREEKKKRKRAQSPVKSARDVRYKDNHINTTYDYLKSTSPRRYGARAADVRYLTDVTRCLRDTLRQICDDRPIVCPNIQNRYSQHRREHHRQGMGQSSSDSNNTDAQESLPMVSTGVPAMSSCEAIQGTYQQTYPTRPKICCYCRKPQPCSCTPRSSVQFQGLPKFISKEPSIESNVYPRLRSLSKDESSCICSGLSVDDFEKNLKKQVFNWLQEVPVYVNDKPEDRSIREDMARKLVEKLKGLKDDEDFEDKAKAKIAECVSNMPMWCPGSKDQDVFKEQIADNLLNKIRNISKKVDKFENEISKWVEGLNLKPRDSQGQIVDKQNVIDNLNKRLKPLALNQPADTQGYKDTLKTEIVGILENLPINVQDDAKTYINSLADKLATQLHTIPAKDIFKRSSVESLEEEFQKQIWEWLEDVPEFSSGSASKVEENQKVVKSLANTLQKLQAQGIEDSNVQEQMQNEINEWLETNVREKSRLDQKTKTKLAEKLLQKLINTSESAAKKKAKNILNEDNVTLQIWDWLSDIPELAGGNQLDNQKMVENLASKLFELRSEGNDDSELEKEILNWLMNSFENKGERLDIKNQSNLVNNLLNKIKTLSTINNDDQLIQDIWNCFEDVPELDMTSKKSKDMVKQLANKIIKLQSQKQRDINDEEMKEEIDTWLNKLNKNTGTKIGTQTRNQLMQKLMKISTSTPKQRKRWSKQDNLQQAISDEISSILEKSSPKLDNGNKINLQNKISNLLSRNIDKLKSGDGSGEIKMQIIDILEQEAQIFNGNAMKVANDIINKVQKMTLPEPSISVHSDQLKNTLREEVGLILDELNVHCDNRDEIESTLTDVLLDQVMRGEDDRQTKNKLVNALRDSDIPKEKTEEIASKLIHMGKEVSLSQKTQDSTMGLGTSKLREFEALSPMHKVMFQNSAEQEIIDFIQQITGESSVLSLKKYKAAAEKLAQKVVDIMSNKDTTNTDKREDVENEISKYLQSISISPDEFHASELADKLQKLAFKTSTPKRLSLDRGFSFRPQRDSRGSTMSSIEDACHFKIHASTPSEEEEQYMNKLVERIDSWMNGLPIDLDTEDGKGFKEVMIKDLAGDIIDRQKYLQLNPDAKTSDEEELEHLKYQVFRWLNKLPDAQEILPSISKADYLMERIKAVPVPQLVKAPERRFSKQIDSYIQHLSQDLSSLQYEISKWIGAVPSKFYATIDKDHHQQMVKDLARQIDQLHREEVLTETLLEDVVSGWLQKMLKEYNEQYFGSLTEGLKGVLLNKGLISLLETSMLAKQSSHLIQENLISFMLDWLKEKPLYQRRLSTEKREQENIVAELAKNLKDILKDSHPTETHRDERVLDEIKSQLKKFPMESQLKLDEDFHHSTANELLEYMKMSQLIQNISEFQSQSQLQVRVGVEEMLPVLEEWIDSLPLQVRKTSVENKKLDSLKQEFAKTLQQLKQQHPAPNEISSEVLKNEISKYLHQLPIEPAKKKDPKFVSDKIDKLHKKLIRVQSQLTTPDRPSISVDGLKEVIFNWAKKLPFKSGKSIETSKDEVDKIVLKFKDMLSNVPEDGFQNVKANVEKEIKGFLNKLPLQKTKLKDDYVQELMSKLNDFAKTSPTSRPSMNTDSSLSSKSGFKKAADILYDNIEDWCENLPIQSGTTPEEKAKVKTLKQNIASKLINIIGDLNVNPEIFNDDLLYEDLLNDQIDNLLSTLPPSPELENNLPALKANLIEKVKEAKVKTQDELAGQAYKQQLRDAISKTLPSIENLSIEEQAPFEVLKDNLADAYINLHYAAGDEETKIKFKNKISDEINQFCDDYLQRYPASPVDPRKLNRDLYSVLQKVPAPKDETIKTQVEQVRIKDEINDWLKEIPLVKDLTPAEQLQKNKIVSVLTKRLHDIEKEKEYNPDIDVEERMQKEIKKWIKRLPMQPGEEGRVDEMIEKLTSKLKNTEESRRFSVTNIRRSIDNADDERPCHTACPFYSKFDRPANQTTPSTSNRYLSQYAPPFPPSTLGTEDRAHLERIRERNQQKQLSFKPTSPSCCKDASVNPIPIETASQTDVGPGVDSGNQNLMQPRVGLCSGGQSPPSQSSDFAPFSQGPVSPQVVVKEYYWDSADPTTREPGYTAPSGQQNHSESHQGQKLPCGQQPQQQQQLLWPQSQANLTPRFGPVQQPSPCSGPQSQFPSPDQTRMPQASNLLPRFGLSQQPSPCSGSQGIFPSPDQSKPQASGTISPPAMMQSPYTSQQPRPPHSYIPTTPQMTPQAPSMSQPQIRPGQSQCINQPSSMLPRASQMQPQHPSAPPYMATQPSAMTSQLPCMMSKQSRPPQMRQSCLNQTRMTEPHSPYMMQYDRNPCITTPPVSQPQMPPCQSQESSRQRSQPSEHIPPCHSQEYRRETRKPFRQPCFGSPEMSSTSSPFDTGPDADSRFCPKVTRLGSLDDVPCTKNCGSQSPRAKRSRGSPDEDYEWTIRFPEDEGFWGTPCPRRRVHRSPMRSSEGAFVKEKVRKEEKLRCRCQERILTKCMGRRPQQCRRDDEPSNCSKCCGAHCPHPSYLYFR